MTVSDTGCGIPREALPHLFERFYRVPDARGRTHEGTGIGLTLVQEIVNLHGASIEVRSQLGEGTTVLVTVPGRTANGASVRAIEPESSATRAQAFVTEAQGWLPDSRGAPTIVVQRNSDNGFTEAQLPSAARGADGIVMLAEDNADMRDYIRRLLEQRFTVITARDGLEALELLRKNKPDLLLTDVMMPHLDGFGLLRAVREDPQSAQLPVILLSARAGEESRVEGLQHGADDYLVKPFSARELLARVSTHIGLARLKRESREAVQRIEQRFSIAVESSAIGFCIFDAVRDDRERIVDFTLSYINPVGALALGRPPEKLVGLCVSDAALGIWDASMFLDAFVRTVETGESLNVEVHSTAGLGWFHNIAAKLGDGLVVWFTETTPAKNAEAQLRASREELRRVTDIASVMLAHCDRENRYLFVNRAYAARFGLTPGQVIGRTIPEVVGERAFAAFEQYTLQALAGERIEFEVEIPYERIGAHFMHCVYAPDIDATGRVQGFVAAISDVSERRALERQLREADRRKDEFLATLAHELRNPLAPIRQAAQIAKASKATDAQLSWSHAVIERQVTHMALLLDDLLDVSRITRGKLDLRQEHIDLQGVIDAAIETARPTIEGRGHTLSIEVDPVPVPLYADRVRLAQVLANLLTNAAKYTDRGGFIRLRANVDTQEVTVRVTDNGTGIASDALLSIFEMFYQVSSALQRADGGLGIGLALVKGLVELHGGTVEAHSEGLGHGSEFIVRLPLAPADALAVPSSRATRRIESSNAPSRLRVLIADDNRDAAQSLAMLLQMEGYEVHLAFDGDDAVAATAQFLPRVLLLDIGMPKRNGYEVAESLRAQDSLGPMTLIALTGWGKSQDKDRALSSGFDHHLTKPVDISAVLALLDRVARGDDDVRGMSAS